MADEEEQVDPEVELARLSEERRLMEQLAESKGWKHLSQVIQETVQGLQTRTDTTFLQITFGETKLDGMQSLVYEGYSKGIRAGLAQALAVPGNIIARNSDLEKLASLKIARNEEKENGSSTNRDSGGEPDTSWHEFASDLDTERNAP